jgi:hypothetical protein
VRFRARARVWRQWKAAAVLAAGARSPAVRSGMAGLGAGGVEERELRWCGLGKPAVQRRGPGLVVVAA